MAEVHVCLVCTDEHYYLRCAREGIVEGYESARRGIETFADTYDKVIARSHEGLMTVFLYALQFQPRVASLREESILSELIGGAPYEIVHLASDVAQMYGIACVGPRAADIYASAREPLVDSECCFSS